MPRHVDLLDESMRPEKIIWKLAWPTMLEQVLIVLVNFVDTAMVGSLGPNATASIALTSAPSWMIFACLGGASVGLSVPVGRCIGAGNTEKAKQIVRQAVLVIAVIGVLLTSAMQFLAPRIPVWMGAEEAIRGDATAYLRIMSIAYLFNASVQICSNILRCTGDTRTPLIYNAATNVINMALNFFFIYETRTVTFLGGSFTVPGAGLGVRGAAIASVIAIAFSGIMLLRSLFSKHAVCRITLKDDFRFDGAVWRDMLSLGSPVIFERVSISLGQTLMAAMVTGLGTASLAAHSLGMTAESLTYMPAFGFSTAATALVAQSLGARRPDLAKKFTSYCTIGCVAFMSLMGFVLYFGAEFLIGLFTPSAEVVRIGAGALRVEALVQPVYALASVIPGVLRGARRTKSSFIMALIGMWVVRLPVCYFFTQYTSLGLTGAWIGMASDLFVRGMIALVLLLRGRWLLPKPGDELA